MIGHEKFSLKSKDYFEVLASFDFNCHPLLLRSEFTSPSTNFKFFRV
jgi:hypothetical protein